MRRLVSSIFDDRRFLELLGRFERVLARVLAVALGLVIVVATFHLLAHMAQAVYRTDVNLMKDGLVPLLGELLTLLIALEVLQSITAYLQHHTIQLELVLATALTALARKVIVLKPDVEDPALLIVALGAAIVFLSAGYWMVRKPMTTPPSRVTATITTENQGDLSETAAGWGQWRLRDYLR